MSGVGGVVFLDGRPVDVADLERMLDRLAHRGPDGASVWSSGSVALGCRIFRTTPESLHEKLPLVDHVNDLVLTADARLDNRDELIAALDLSGRSPDAITDAELLLGAYRRWSDDCASKLLGDFALAIWDGRARRLFCARDHFGVRPFYYYRSGRLFAFASEIKALLCLADVPRRLNEVRVADYLVPMLEDKEITFYQDILRLPAGHTLTVGPGQARPRCYWSLDPTREIRCGSDEEYAEAFRAIFTEAVRCRLRSVHPVGSMLSGGLDSSSIVCVGRRLLEESRRPTLHTISAIFDDLPECDERFFINAVVRGGGVEPHYVRGDALSPLGNLDRVLWHQDEPFWNLYLFMHWGVCGTASSAGVRVLLDGFGRDSIVSYGIDRLRELIRAGKVLTFATQVRRLQNS